MDVQLNEDGANRVFRTVNGSHVYVSHKDGLVGQHDPKELDYPKILESNFNVQCPWIEAVDIDNEVLRSY